MVYKVDEMMDDEKRCKLHPWAHGAQAPEVDDVDGGNADYLMVLFWGRKPRAHSAVALPVFK